MPSGKREAAGFHFLGALARAQPLEIRERRAAAEQTLGLIRQRLGAPGTYEQVPPAGPILAPTSGPALVPGEIPEDVAKHKHLGRFSKRAQALLERQDGMFETKPIYESIPGMDVRKTLPSQVPTVKKLTPGVAAAEVEKSAEFRIVSRMMAESEQMLKREGPLWDEMIKNTQLPIIEGSAAMARENAESVRRAMQRGGAARRNAFEAVQQMRSQERINSQRVQTIAQSRLAIDGWAREHAQTVVEFSNNWSANVAGIRETYNQAMDKASELMTSQALPLMFATKQAAAQWRAAAHAKQRNKLKGWITGAIGLATMVAAPFLAPAIGGVAAGGLMQAGLGTLGGAFGGTPTPEVVPYG